ncbi:MAG: heavy metal translocating P-type ATPase [Gammaproteobacteria bacterium]|nr:heavy metal translocating P-type ATPase [Gammaproteobacteria bacterium]MCP5458671.1 heavy metal translocating P-type ATPase [Gammaproteobacteria bacterium]
MSGFFNELRIVHEAPGRMRLRGAALSDEALNGVVMESWMESLAEVRGVRLNRPAGSLIVEYSGGATGRDKVVRRLRSFSLPDTSARGDHEEREAEWTPMVTAAMGLAVLPFLNQPARRLLTFLSVGSTLLKGLDTLVNRGIKVEVLDALAVGLATVRDEHYTANITHFLLALGEYLERRTERQSDRLLRRLLRPDPALAWVERDGEVIRIPGDEVRQGEIVVVGVGERVPVDGRVVEGAALVNQAAVTGEDVPVRKEAPRRVISGSVVVEGRIRFQATQVGEDTTSARIARFIQESLDKRPHTQRLAEELADKRVYFSLGTGAAVYALTRNLTRLESVFLVDYSCALKLGTPVAFKSGMYQAAANGVLMKGGDAIEQLAAVDTMVFDKTGTLTHSELIVTDVEVLTEGGCSATELLALVASVEEHANHPVAKAVVEAARERDLEHISHGEIDYLVAHGMNADVRGGHIVIGSRHYLEEHQGIAFTDFEPLIDRLQEEGKTLLYVGNRQGPVGLIALRDTVREEASATLRRLRRLGIERLIMITGDRRQKAQVLADELGLDEVHAEMPPEDKAEVIKGLQAAGRKVAFIGDGVNDGPALATAEVGVAMPRGADIARATADVVLLDDRLGAVADAREVASRTMKLIRANFNLAVGVNTALLGGAVTGALSPVASALLHNGATIGILLNALKGVRLESTDIH